MPKDESIEMMEEDDDSKIFPQRLMEILSDEVNEDAICWLPHGRAFIIRSRQLFSEKIMPRFFPRKAKYSSFTRKLNRWNFVRVSSGPEIGAYYHEFFLRDKPQLAAQMFCKNARAKLAMANDTPKPVAAVVETLPSSPPKTATEVPMTFGTAKSLHPLLLAAVTKGQSDVVKGFIPNTFGATPGLQFLEQQMHLLRQEKVHRLLMDQLSLFSPQLPSPQLTQMRQLLELRARQRQGMGPNNARASAA